MLKYFRNDTSKQDWFVVAWLITVSIFKYRSDIYEFSSSMRGLMLSGPGALRTFRPDNNWAIPLLVI